MIGKFYVVHEYRYRHDGDCIYRQVGDVVYDDFKDAVAAAKEYFDDLVTWRYYDRDTQSFKNVYNRTEDYNTINGYFQAVDAVEREPFIPFSWLDECEDIVARLVVSVKTLKIQKKCYNPNRKYTEVEK